MTKSKNRFVLCIDSGAYRASLEPRKVYRVIDDPARTTCFRESVRADRSARKGEPLGVSSETVKTGLLRRCRG